MANNTNQTNVYSKNPAAQKEQKRLIIGSAIVVGLIILIIALGVNDLLPHFNGSLHYVGGKVLGVGENDLIINTADDNGHKYYCIGSVTTPEGYKDDPSYSIKTDECETEFAFVPVSVANAPKYLSNIVVCGVSRSFEDRIDAVHNLTAVTDEEGNTTYSERIDAVTSNGTSYSGYIYGTDEPDELNQYYRYYYAFIPTNVDDTCIMIAVNTKVTRKLAIPSDEELIELMKMAADCVTVK